MTARRLPRSFRGRALPRSGDDTVTWPPALRGRSLLPCLVVLGWLGGGLLATTLALVTDGQNDLEYGLINTGAALLALLVLAVAPRRRAPGEGARGAVDEPVPVEVPAQPDPDHDDRRVPALR